MHSLQRADLLKVLVDATTMLKRRPGSAVLLDLIKRHGAAQLRHDVASIRSSHGTVLHRGEAHTHAWAECQPRLLLMRT